MLGELRTHLGLLALVAVTSFGRFTVGAGLFNATVEAIFWFLLRLSTQSRVVSLKLWCSGVPLLVVSRAIQKEPLARAHRMMGDLVVRSQSRRAD